MPKAAVSRAVADLETALGVRVLNRTTRRLSLTEAGQLIYPNARRLADEADAGPNADRTLVRPAHRGPGGLRPTRPTAAFCWRPWCPRFMESFPDIPLEVSLQPQAQGEGRGSDVAIRTGTGEEPGMAHRLLGAPPAILCATPAYLQRRGTPERPDDLRAHDLLTPEGEGPEFHMTLSHGAMRAEIRVTSRLAVNDPSVLHAATRRPGWVSASCPNSCVGRGWQRGRLKLLLPDWQLPQIMPLYAVYPATQGADTRVQRFVGFPGGQRGSGAGADLISEV